MQQKEITVHYTLHNPTLPQGFSLFYTTYTTHACIYSFKVEVSSSKMYDHDQSGKRFNYMLLLLEMMVGDVVVVVGDDGWMVVVLIRYLT